MAEERHDGGWCVDVHTHVVPESFPGYAGRHADVRWPSMRPVDACHSDVVIAGSVFRTVTDDCWSVARRLERMDEMAVRFQVLSPMPELLSYWIAPEDAAALARYVNGEIATMTARAPGSFAGLGATPLQDVDLAISEMEFAVRELGLKGVEIGTNVNGVSIGDNSFDPFFAAAAELDAAVFVHALRPVVGRDRLIGPPSLAASVGFPCETALAIVSLITGGVLERYPGLRLAFSHGGGVFALVLPRLQHVWAIDEEMREAITRSPRDYARTLFYDSLVYDADALALLVSSFGEDQILVGTDYPFAIHDREPVNRLVALNLDQATFTKMTVSNAERFIGIVVAK